MKISWGITESEGHVALDKDELAKCETLEDAIDYAQGEVDHHVDNNVCGICDDADVEALWNEARSNS